MLNIIHISTNNYDGAGRYAYAIHNTLSSLPEVSSTFMSAASLNLFFRFKLGLTKILIKVASVVLLKDSLVIINFCRLLYSPSLPTSTLRQVAEFDVVIFWSTHRFVSDFSIKKICRSGKLILFIPLDLEMITGACHFRGNCDMFFAGCAKCPAIRCISHFSSRTFRDRTSIYSMETVHLIACTIEMRDLIRSRDPSNPMPVDILRLGVCERRRRPISKVKARSIINPSWNRERTFIILIAAINWKDPRKGGALLPQIVATLDSLLSSADHDLPKVKLVSLGHIDKSCMPQKTTRIEFNELKPQFDDRYMNAVYRSSDIFLSLSLDDVGPLTVLEALSNDLPVAGFDIGILRELPISTKISLTNAESHDAKNLARVISQQIHQVKSPGANRVFDSRIEGLNIPNHEAYTQSLLNFIADKLVARNSPSSLGDSSLQ